MECALIIIEIARLRKRFSKKRLHLRIAHIIIVEIEFLPEDKQMKLAVQTSRILDVYGIDEGFRMIAEAGFDGVDANLDHCLPSPLIRSGELNTFFDQSDADILAFLMPYAEAAKKYGVAFSQAHAPFPCRVANDETNAYVWKALKKTAMMCDYLDCRYMVVHSGFMPEGEREYPDEWDYNMRMYSDLMPALRKYNVTCCLENLFTRWRGKIMEGVCSNADEAVRYVDTLNSMAGEELFGFCFDVGHANLTSKDVYRYLITIGKRLKILHVHDNNGVEDEHLFPYMGIVNWDRFCRGMKEIGFSGTMSFETFNGLKTFDSALAPELLRLLNATGRLFIQRIEG